MKVIFHKVSERSYFSTAARDDGVTVRVPGYDRTSPVPHDLAHFIAERELGIGRGFWGSVAAGAMFTNMTVVEGRRRPHADERSRLIIKANGEGLGQCEGVAGAVHEAVEKGQSAEIALEHLRRMHGVVSAEPLAVGAADLAEAISSLSAAADRWAETPIGEGMALTWELPTYEPRRRAQKSNGRKGRIRRSA
ncbi:hypothetical protein J4573_23245 [Actinomadura barringtoniae]|uniref:Uncharacterized protein n=1 Tax=Actinomadura barringtoniae TaxID=1427535 RepID=A0A939T502_9ACTN|nr:hypothetical protein [Actinomadura barringtoniae]MBO2450038.1 hypothetical protein [Actinomadura barringtoniae]